jgi:GTP-binding protein Era
MDQPNATLKSGFAVLVGRTNVGKSTLLNALVGTKVAIVTPKPQTTRDTYHGIVTRPGVGQIVFVDTPGFFKTQPSRLVHNLHHRVRNAVEGIDVVVHVVDPSRSAGPEDQRVIDMVDQMTQPKILCINKSDLPSKPFRETWLKRSEKYAAVVEVSARREEGIDLLIRAIFSHLPVGPLQYPEGQLTNVTNEFWISELIREKIYLQMSEELPYTSSVQVEAVEDRKSKAGDKLVYIKAAILTTGDRYKGMLVGAGGRKIKNIGSAARKELEVALNTKVFLDLAVIVDDEWMDRMG